jgi:NAD(P)-dependent dehydrogenase (short-subunit alcohol dehydrogenase family)/acyl carrier protein
VPPAERRQEPALPPEGPAVPPAEPGRVPNLAPPSTLEAEGAWVEACREMQAQMAATHAACQRVMAESHQAFLKATEASFNAVAALATGKRLPAQPPDEAIPPSPPATEGTSAPEPAAAVQTRPEPVIVPEPVSEPAAAASEDLTSLLLSVVSDKTGYPTEMLKLEMGLETDLGIDSIKRVEILAALQERVPNLPQLPASEIASLKTLGEIVERLTGGAAGSPAAAPGELPAESEPEASAGEPLALYAVEEVAARESGLAMGGLFSSGPVAITDEGTGVAEALATRLLARGLEARVVEAVPPEAGVVVFLGGLRAAATRTAAIEVNRVGFHAAQAAAPRLSSRGGVFVTVQDTGGDFGLSGRCPTRAWLGGLSALAKTAALEWPLASVKAIDMERAARPADELADVLEQEMLAGGPEREVGLHADGGRFTLRGTPAAPPGAEPAFDSESVIVASGGARGVTARALLALARSSHPRIALLGRTELREEPECCRGLEDVAELSRALLGTARGEGRTPDPAQLRAEAHGVLAGREIRATLAALEAAGAAVRYFSVDVRDEARLRTTLAEVRETFGPIGGLVHGAGVVADKLLGEKTQEQFDRVFDTKVMGLSGLLSATADDPLRSICLFSSIAARGGNPGQSDYAMANEVLNKVAACEARRRGASCLVRSINWGPWDGGMVGPGLKALFAKRGIPLIPLEEGAQILLGELSRTPASQVEVVVGGTPDGAWSLETRPAETAADVLVSSRTHPYLDSHRVQDTPVVPVVMVLEWFVRAASAGRPDLVFSACHDLKVLRGIQLELFGDGGQALRLACREVSNTSGARMALELRGADDSLCYTGEVEMTTPTLPRPETTPAQSALPTLEAFPWSVSEVYDRLLFHGPDFRVIRSLDGVAANGCSAVLAGTRELGWTGGPWRTDVAALDGGLQLAILWGIHKLGRRSLPTSVGGFVSHGADLVEGPIRCTLTARSVGEHRTLSDLVFTTPDGRLVAELRDLEMHVPPSEKLLVDREELAAKSVES